MNTEQKSSDPGFTVHYPLKLTVNGTEYEISIQGDERLLDILRERLGLLGVKEGCGAGECGACTVIMNGRKVNSCMVFAGQADGAEILTIEGFESADGKLHPLQEAFLETGAVQCGFCTPGMILSSYDLLSRVPDPADEEIREELSGNLCRCTGYSQIVSAVHLAAEKMNGKK